MHNNKRSKKWYLPSVTWLLYIIIGDEAKLYF